MSHFSPCSLTLLVKSWIWTGCSIVCSLGLCTCGVAQRDPVQRHQLLSGVHCLSFWCNKSLGCNWQWDPCGKLGRRRDTAEGLPISRGRAGGGDLPSSCWSLLGPVPPGHHQGLLLALGFSCLCHAMLVVAYAASASSPSHKGWIEGTVNDQKKEEAFEEETHDTCVPAARGFLRTPASCEMVPC